MARRAAETTAVGLITSRTTLCSSNFVHFGYSLLKFLVLAFLVRVSLILRQCQSSNALLVG